MKVHWLEQVAENVPAGNGWLSSHEIGRLAEMRFPKRSTEWRLGRWTAKLAIARYLGISSLADIFSKIELRPELLR